MINLKALVKIAKAYGAQVTHYDDRVIEIIGWNQVKGEQRLYAIEVSDSGYISTLSPISIPSEIKTFLDENK